MNWSSNLYVAPECAPRAGKIRQELDHGRYPAGVFLITFSGGRHLQLEIIRPRMYSLCESSQTVVGLAGNRTQALELLRWITQDCWRDTGTADLCAYLSDKMHEQA